MKRLIGSSLFVFICLVLLIVMMGGHFQYYIDLPSLILVLIFPFIYQLFLFGFAKMRIAFTAPLYHNSSEEDLALSLNYFKTQGKITWLFALMSMGLSIIAVLGNIDDLNRLGSYIAITILSVAYAAVIDLALVTPYISAAKQAHEEKIRKMKKAGSN